MVCSGHSADKEETHDSGPQSPCAVLFDGNTAAEIPVSTQVTTQYEFESANRACA